MSCVASRRWFPRARHLFGRVADLVRPSCCKPLRQISRPRLLSLEERFVPATSIAFIEAVAYNGAVKVTHDQTSGDVEGFVRWGDGSTTSFGSWPHTLPSKTFTHPYSSPGKFTVTTESKSSVVEDTDYVTINAETPPAMPVDGGMGLEWGKTATPTGNNPNNFSAAGVRFADGVVKFAVTDLSVAGFGMGWGPSRSWTNGPGYADNRVAGNGWVDAMPSIVQVDGTNTLAVVIDGTNARTFDIDETEYVERFFGQNRLVHDSGEDQYVLTTPDGVVYQFWDFTVADEIQRGQFESRTDPNGNVTEVTDRDGDGRITEVTRGGGDEVWEYDYVASGDNAGKLLRVTLKRDSVAQRKVEYAYYGASEDHGNLGDLKTATVLTPGDVTISVQYHRYYKPGETGGYTGGLKMYLGFASYARAAAGLTVATASDNDLDDFADLAYKYDATRRVSEVRVQGQGCSMCSAGIGTYTYSYTSSAFGAGVNSWSVEAVEDLPGDDQVVAYTNAYGQVMIKSTREIVGSTVEREWPVYYRYDADGRVILAANTSAMNAIDGDYYDKDYADLVAESDGDAAYLKDASGLFTVYVYAGSTSGGIDDDTAGDLAGYLKSVGIARGEDNIASAIGQADYAYFAVESGGVTIHPLATSTVYADEAGTEVQTTEYAYDFTNLRIDRIDTTYPTVTTASNGPNTAVTVGQSFDSFGRVVWSKDGEGYLTYREYHDATGALIWQIADADSSSTIGYSASSPWTKTGGQMLQSRWSVDFLGRATAYFSPVAHTNLFSDRPIDYTIYDDVNHEVRFYPAWESSLTGYNGPTGPIRVYREDWGGRYAESLTMSAVAGYQAVTITLGSDTFAATAPTGTELIGSMQSLSRTLLNAAGQATATHAYFKVSDVTYSDASVTLTGPSSAVRHYASETDYSDRGWVKRTVTPNGTITRYVHDTMGRVVQVWVGTNDSTSIGFWSPTNTIGPSNMTLVTTHVYDGSSAYPDTQGVGDGNVTRVSQDPGTAAVRNTDHYYDWRNRRVATKQGVEGSETTTLNRQISFVVYDNLNRVVESRTYDGDGETIGFSDGVPVAPSDSLRRSKSTTEYDDRGRVFRTRVYSIDPSSGSEGRDLTTDYWYDGRGLTIKTAAPGAPVWKMSYDGAGRLIAQYATDGGDDSVGYSAADDVTGDVVYEQTEFDYDENGQTIKQTQRLRHHDASGTGALGNVSTNPKARLYFAASYFDRAGRLIETANVGTNAGSTTWTRPAQSSLPLSRSDTLLVETRTYDAAGRLYQVFDARNIQKRTEHDALGRTVKTIEAYVDGTVSAQDDKTTEFTYDGSNHLLTYKAWTTSTDSQTTQYVYGVVSGSGGNEITSNDLLGVVLYPDPSTGSPSPAQFTYAYNALGERIRLEDINDTVHEYTFDVMGRPVADKVTSYDSGVIDNYALRQETAYDSAGRAYLFTNYSAASGGSVRHQVQREYNGFGQVTKEYLQIGGAVTTTTTPKVQYAYSTSGNHSRLTAMTYPTSTQVLSYLYTGGDDTISRLSGLDYDGDTIEEYGYLGLGTVVKRAQPEADIEMTYIDVGTGDAGDQYVGLDRFGRIADLTWKEYGSSSVKLDHFKYGYDRNGNRLYRTNELDHTFDELYHADGNAGYDSLNQLQEFQRGTLTDGYGSDGILDTVSSSSRSQSWTMDGLGNFPTVTTDGVSQTRTHDSQNKLTEVEVTGSSTSTLAYDAAGNMITDELGNEYKYDAWNRLIVFGPSQRRWLYDALGRRVRVIYEHADGPLYIRNFYYTTTWQLIEEQSAFGGYGETLQYVWTPGYVDGLVARFQDTDGNGSFDEAMYALTDANWNVMGLVFGSGGSVGTVAERYVYDPYGRFDTLDASRASRTTTLYSWDIYHQGGRFDRTIGFYHFRHRDYSPTLMRWVGMDPLASMEFGSSLYSFANNSPHNYLDSTGVVAVHSTMRDTTGAQTPPKLLPGEDKALAKCKCKVTDLDENEQRRKSRGWIQCDGNGDLEVVLNPGINEDGCPELNECHRAHEQHHIEQAKARCPGACIGQPKGKTVGYQPNCRSVTECYAHTVSIECLKRALKDPKVKAVCKMVIRFRIKEEVELMRNAYKCGQWNIPIPDVNAGTRGLTVPPDARSSGVKCG